MMTEEKVYTLDDLNFVKFLLPSLIPRHLIEQVKGRAFSVDDFYKYAQECVDSENPYSLIYALINPDKEIVGYLWMDLNPLDNSMFVNTFSIDKIYWKKGEAMKKAVEFVKLIANRMKVKTTIWMTTNAKFYERLGFKRCKDVAMEYKEE